MKATTFFLILLFGILNNFYTLRSIEPINEVKAKEIVQSTFAAFPKDYQTEVLASLKQENKSLDSASVYDLWAPIGKRLNIKIMVNSGYLFFKPFFSETQKENYKFVPVIDKNSFLKGSRIDLSQESRENWKDFFNAENEDDRVRQKEAAEVLAANYKIHLMPQDKDTIPMIFTFLDKLKADPDLRNLISSFKYKIDPSEIKDARGNFLPKIVIYPADGKENAQKALNKIFAIFKNNQGTGQTPRFNQAITSLIFVSQGNADDKAFKQKDYFEQSDMIYFKPDFTGEVKDYHLNAPIK